MKNEMSRFATVSHFAPGYSTRHCAADCRSNRKCLLSKCKHHTSICKKRSDEISEPMLASTDSSVIYPVAIINVNCIKCRVLLDTDSGSSYGSQAIIDLPKINPIRKEYKTIETLTNSTTTDLRVYSAKIQDFDKRVYLHHRTT